MTGTKIYLTIMLSLASGAAYQYPQWSYWGGLGLFDWSNGAYGCKAPVIATSWSPQSRSLAETRALVIWAKRAARYGGEFTTWHNAVSRDVSCKPIGRGIEKCVVRARPCPPRRVTAQRPAPSPYF